MSHEKRDRVFLYCPETAGKDAASTESAMKNRGYRCVKLTDNSKTFWDTVNSVQQNGILILLSHGDESGPLMVKGNDGKDMTDEEINALGTNLVSKKIAFYCISCNTGILGTIKDKNGKETPTFASSLCQTKAYVIAPNGKAKVNLFGSVSLSVIDTKTTSDGREQPGRWVEMKDGKSRELTEYRAAKPLPIP